MTRAQLVFVHGRAQENLDAVQLKKVWVNTWKEGLSKNGLTVPLSDSDIRFPYYGDTLFSLSNGATGENVPEVVVRGDGPADPEQREFLRSVLEETRQANGITEEQLAAVEGTQVVEMGPLNWGWVRGILKAVDTYVRGGSGAAVALTTNDVYQYLRNPGLRDVLETGVRAALTPGVPTVVVGHSLGSVVAYNLLRREGQALGWKVPLFVTVGSPLAVTAIKRSLMPIRHPACADSWYNAMDPNDVVSLYPLDAEHFDVDPAIVNNVTVDNQTENQHGIAGYLNDGDVARRIYDALM